VAEGAEFREEEIREEQMEPTAGFEAMSLRGWLKWD
jgi:hypothetical protein